MRTLRRLAQIISSGLLIAVVVAACNMGANSATSQSGGQVIGQRTKTISSSVTVLPGDSLPTLPAIGQRTKMTGCVANDGLPDSACTPGAIFADVTKDQVCAPGYGQGLRNVPDSVKNQVFAEYGIASHTTGEYEVDHLISLELGGTNDIANLWPEPTEPRPGFYEKEKVENYLHKAVCDGALSIADAQSYIASDWLSVYSSMPK
jgi:hypothetical protein